MKFNILLMSLIATSSVLNSYMLFSFVKTERNHRAEKINQIETLKEKVSKNTNADIREIIREELAAYRENNLPLAQQNSSPTPSKSPPHNEDENVTEQHLQNAAPTQIYTNVNYTIEDSIALGNIGQGQLNNILTDVGRAPQHERAKLLSKLAKSINKQQVKIQ